MLWKRLRHRKMQENDLIHHLLYATVSRDVRRVEELIECGIDPCSQMEDGTSPIHKAAVMETPHGPLIISRMLRYGADPNVTTPTGLSPLHIAAMWGRVETIDMLIDNGADVFLKDDDDRSALDYADEAEENRNACIDALTRYRGTPCRRRSGSTNGGFLTKSRLNLDKIIGGDVSFSDKSFKTDVPSEKSPFKADSIHVEQETLLMRHHTKRKRKLLRNRLSFSRHSRVNVAVQTDTPKNKQTEKQQTDTPKNKQTDKQKMYTPKNKQTDKQKMDKPKNKQTDKQKMVTSKNKQTGKQTHSVENLMSVLDIDVPDRVPDTTVFESCDDDTLNSFSRDDSKCIISSTLLEDQTVYDSAVSVQEMSPVEEEVKKHSSRSSSSSSKSTSTDDTSSINEALRQSTPVTKTSSNQVETIAIVHMPRKKHEHDETTDTYSTKHRILNHNIGRIASRSGRKQSSTKDLVMTQRGSDSNLYIPVSIPTSKSTSCNLNIKISIADAHNNKLYNKRIDTLQIGSHTEPTRKKERIKNDRRSKQHHCYDEIPPLSAKTESTFESAPEYMDNEVKYEEIALIENQQLLETIPSHIGDELKCNEVISPSPLQNTEPSKIERSHIDDELKSKNELSPRFQYRKDVRSDIGGEVACIDIVPPPFENEHFLETIPDHIGDEFDSNKVFSPLQTDDALESSPRNINEDLSNDVDYSEISDISESFINLDAQNLMTYGDMTFEATIELNQPTIDYINTNVNNNATVAEPTIDDVNTNINYDVPASDPNLHYSNTNVNNNAPVAELVHYFEEKSIEESIITRQIEITNVEEEDIVTLQFDTRNAEENIVARQVQKINCAEEKTVTPLFERTSPEANMVACRLERKRNNEENIITRQLENKNIEDNIITRRIDMNDMASRQLEERAVKKRTATLQFETRTVTEDTCTRQLEKGNVEEKCIVSRQHVTRKTEENRATLELEKTSVQSGQESGDETIVTRQRANASVNSITGPRQFEQNGITQRSSIFYVEDNVTDEQPIRTHDSSPNTSGDINSSVMYEESSEENDTMISARDCIHSCGDEEESSSSSALDETDDVNIIKIPVVEVFQKPRGLLAEYADVCVNYGWKDVCGFSREFEDTMITVPSRILTLHDDELRGRLKRIGVTAHEITDNIRKIYQRHLVKVEMSNHLALKPNEMYEDYTLEMAQVLCGSMDLREESGALLETEMTLQFTNPEKYTWREGTQNTSFNFLLLDPRVTKNLPGRAENMSYLETFKVFIASIFCVGRGRKCRTYEHLEEAARYISKPQSNKVNMIHDIWASGLGIVSLHVFNNIIPVEAFTREACMIEAMGLSRLTNTKLGDLYGSAASWNTKKQRLLGIYNLMKAMEIFLSEGEYQIRMKDLESSEVRNSNNTNKDESMHGAMVRALSVPSACGHLQPPRLSLNGASLRDPFFCSK